MHILPPIDIFLGKGLYIFPNYRKWPVVRSKSYLYVHDLTFVRYPEYVQPKNLQYLQKYLIRWARTATRIITISEFSKQEIEDYFKIPEEQITVVPCGVDTSVFYQRSKLEIDNIKKRYGITTQKYIFYIGNLEPRKNLVNLVKAFSGLPQKIKNEYALVIVGGGGWLNEGIYKAIETAKSNGTTIIQPTVYVADADVPALFSGATALVHPAYYEGFGLSILQAMACKTPVLVAKNSSIPELVGNAGLYLNPNSEEDIAKKIMTIISNKDLSDRLVVSGLQRAKIFDWDTSARKLLNLS